MAKKVLILGGGPGGYSAALFGSALGLSVTLIEKDLLGGVCLNRGCIPTKTLLAVGKLFENIKKAPSRGIKTGFPQLDPAIMVERKNKIVERLRTGLEFLLKKRGINLVKGEGKLLSAREIAVNGESLTGDAVILATGSSPLKLWQKEDGVITSDEALELTRLPQSLLVIGGGAVGVELATCFAALEVKVTLVEQLPRLIPQADPELSELLSRELAKKGIQVKTACEVKKIENQVVELSGDFRAGFELILQAVGRKMNTGELGLEKIGLATENGRLKTNTFMETEIPGVYAVGDIVAGAPLLAHSAYHQGKAAAFAIAGKPQELLAPVPCCVFSSPPLAWVGKLESQVPDSLTAKIPFRILGKAQAEEETAGILKLVAEKESRKILGVHIAGEGAAELVHLGALAIKQQVTVEELASLVIAHPTFSELYSEAALALCGTPFHFLP